MPIIRRKHITTNLQCTVLPNVTAFLNGHQTHISDEGVAFDLDLEVGVTLRWVWHCGCVGGVFCGWEGDIPCHGVVPAAWII